MRVIENTSLLLGLPATEVGIRSGRPSNNRLKAVEVKYETIARWTSVQIVCIATTVKNGSNERNEYNQSEMVGKR